MRNARLINGSILSNFSHLELSTAEEKTYSLKMTPFTRLAMNLIGVPHLGFRMRARIILKEARKATISEKILDAGCGYGLYAMSLAESGYQVDAVDFDERRIQVLTEMSLEYPVLKNNLSLSTGSLTALHFPADSYDTIICSEVIEHIKDDHAAVAELARVLKPNGTLILSVPYDSSVNKRLYRRFDHERPGYTRDSLRKIFEANSLSIQKDFYYERVLGSVLFNIFNTVHSKPLMGLLFYPFYFFYLLDYYLGLGEPNQMVVVARKES